MGCIKVGECGRECLGGERRKRCLHLVPLYSANVKHFYTTPLRKQGYTHMAKGKKSKRNKTRKQPKLRNPYALHALMRRAWKRINKRKQASKEACRKNGQNKIPND